MALLSANDRKCNIKFSTDKEVGGEGGARSTGVGSLRASKA